jgi:tetratricopeptide (TPR) repeat protein
MRYLQPNNHHVTLRNLINPSLTLIEYVNSTKLNTPNIIFIRKILSNTNKKITETSPIENELILFIKLLEFYFLQKYNKDLQTISATLRKINIGDFLVGNLFLFENVYDDVKSTYSKFKEKVYWNFGEIISSVFTPLFPKMLKKTLLRHIQYMPQDDCLTYHLIQYYYTNKDFRKSKILIRKILAKDDSKSEIIFDIHSISLMMLVNILISEEKYGEALDNAIFNLERLKDGIKRKSNESNGRILINPEKQNEQNSENAQIISRSYFILGFCYSKVGDNATNFEEKLKYSQLALSSFKSAIEDTKEDSNPNFGYFFARQYYDLKLYTLAEETLHQIIDNSSASNVNVSNNHHFQSLKILIYIAGHQYDAALRLCETLIRNNHAHLVKFSTIVVLKFYLLIQKLFNNTGDVKKDEEILIHKMSEYIKILFDAIEEETKSLDLLISGTSGFKQVRKSISERSDGFLNQHGGNAYQLYPNGSSSIISQETSFKIQLDPKQVEVKELIKFSDFEPYLKENISDEELKSSVKVFLNEKKNLENIRLELLKNFYLLADMLMENNFDKDAKIDCQLGQLLSKTFIPNPNEDINILLVVRKI